MEISEGNLSFTFNGALNGYKFDEQDQTSTHYHGLSHCMKGVDLVIEQEDVWLFIEVKDPSHPDSTPEQIAAFAKKARSTELVSDLVHKYRDTFLYHWAEQKVEKPIHYLCLITLESALVLQLMNQLKRQLPEGRANNQRWQRAIADRCIVANLETWNSSFPHIPVQRVRGE